VRRAGTVFVTAIAAALALSPAAEAAPLHWSTPAQIDTTPSETPIDGISCVSTTWCVASDDAGHAFVGNPQAGRASWTRVLTGGGGGAIACVSESLCVEASFGQIVSSTQPASGPWSQAKLDGQFTINALACPSAALCVGGDTDGNVLTATDPAGGSAGWTITSADPHNSINAVSCPTTTLCVAVDDAGNVVTSTNPTGGAAAWTVTHEDNGRNRLLSVSCPSTTLCVAVDDDGNVVTTTEPSNPAVPWTLTSISTGPFNSVSCTAGPYCVAMGAATIAVSTAPTGGAGAWTSAPNGLGDSPGFDVVQCITGPFCLAGDDNGEVQATANPIAGTTLTWTATPLSGLGLSAVSCPTTTLCLAGDALGQVVFSKDPATTTAPWTAGADLGDPTQGLSCPSKSLCVATSGDYGDGETGGAGLFTTSPTATKWKFFDPQEGKEGGNAVPEEFFRVSCASTHLCALLGDKGFYVSIRPSDGKSWRHVKHKGGVADVYCPRKGRCAAPNGACPSSSLCVDLTASGKLRTTTDPRGGARRWKTAKIDPKGHLRGVSCPSAKLCVAVDDQGDVLTSTRPTKGSGAWKIAGVDGGEPLDAVACASNSLCVAVDDDGYAVIGTA
jgi:hypothetical protein